MIKRGKVAYLKKLYPYKWAQVHWMAFRDKLLKHTNLKSHSRVLAIMPEREPLRIMSSTCDGIYPVRALHEPFTPDKINSLIGTYQSFVVADMLECIKSGKLNGQ